ncbi:MAG: hypothetical protein HQ541_03215 [Mariniphaga sp.]|nr:hypothetical protein [Mariniphaga sp.]
MIILNKHAYKPIFDWFFLLKFIPHHGIKDILIMNTSNLTPNNEINYLDIVMKGYSNQNNREHLVKYFIRECKNAKLKYYESDEFFSGCLKIIEAFENDINIKIHKRKVELHFMLSAAKNKNIEYGNEDNSKTYEQRCNDTISYCETELKELSKNDYYVHLPSITNNLVFGNMPYGVVLFIEDAIITAYQKILTEKNEVENSTSQIAEIDFNQTSPDYFLEKASELDSAYRQPLVLNRDFITRNENLTKGNKIGEVGTILPDWPENPIEAFELFKKFYAKIQYLHEVSHFLHLFKKWNEDAIGQEQEKIKKFIVEAKKIDLTSLFMKHTVFDDKEFYLRLIHNFYDSHNIKNDSLSASNVYGKYILFKELLEKKISSKQKEITNKQEGKRILKVADWCIIFHYLEKGDEFEDSKKSKIDLYDEFISENQIMGNNQLTTAKYFKRKYHIICNRINGKEDDMKEVVFSDSNPPLPPERIKKILPFIKKNKKAIEFAEDDINYLHNTIEDHKGKGYYE